jgi:hypothetical protein
MRTLVDIPDKTYQRLESKAAAEGRSIEQLLLLGSELVLNEPLQKPLKRLKSPILNNGEPGSLKLDNDKIDDLIGFP